MKRKPNAAERALVRIIAMEQQCYEVFMSCDMHSNDEQRAAIEMSAYTEVKKILRREIAKDMLAADAQGTAGKGKKK